MHRAVAFLLKKEALVSPGGRVLVALSGGADSVALFHVLREISPSFPFSLAAAHLDHGIRPHSGKDAEFVRLLCEKYGIPLTLGYVDVPALARREKIGIEDAGRRARREFLEKTADEEGCSVVALAHHRNDQAETFLHRLMRGSALTGLASMRVRYGIFIRPFLFFGKDRILRYLEERKLSWVEDESNADVLFTRNRIRHELLPILRQFNPKIEEHLCCTASRIAVEENFWEEEIDRHVASLALLSEREAKLDRKGIYSLHQALRLRFYRRILQKVRGGLEGLSSRHIEAVDGLVTGSRPQGELHLPGVVVFRRYDTLHVSCKPPSVSDDFEIRIDGSGDYPLPEGGVLRVSIEEVCRGEGRLAVEFDASVVPFPLAARSFRTGDRFCPYGMQGTKKVKDLFIDAKIDRESRCRIPIVVAGEILWIAGLRRCAGFTPPVRGGSVLRIEFLDG